MTQLERRLRLLNRWSLPSFLVFFYFICSLSFSLLFSLQMLTFYELDLGLNHVVRKYSEPLEDTANHLIRGNSPLHHCFQL